MSIVSAGVRHLAELDTGKRFRARVVSNARITPPESDEEVRELVLEIERDDFPYAAGQSLGVLAPGDPEFGKRHHFRLYSVADLPEVSASGKPQIKICVRRCFYVDQFTGERYPGVASNYLCDLAAGAELTVNGPFGLAFEVPEDRTATLVLIGTGTGIAPFRAFVKHLFEQVPDWRGRVWLLYGAKSGLELLYQNDVQNDFANYYDHDTFLAFYALSPRPVWADPIGWDYAIEARGEELWTLLEKSNTYVYLAGLEPMRAELEKVFEGLAGSKEAWQRRKSELVAGRRWIELIY